MENSIIEMPFMKLLRKGGAAVFLVLLANPSAYSATYTVSSTSAFDFAAEIAEAGDTIRLQPGSYGSVSVHLPGLGASPITVKPVTRGTVKFVGTLTISGDDVIFDGFEFEGAGKLVLNDLDDSVIKNCIFDDLSSKMWLQIKEASSKITVEHNSFTDKDNSSFCSGDSAGAQLLQIRVGSGTGQLDHRIRWNYFGDISDGCIGNGYETIQIGQGEPEGRDTDVWVEHNLFEHADGESEIISVKTSGNTIRYNTFRQSKGAVVFRAGHNNRAEGNIFLGGGVSGTGGVRIQGNNQVIVNNYFDGLASPLTLMDGGPGEDPLYDEINTATIASNTFIGTSALKFGALHSDGGGTTVTPAADVRFLNNLLVRTSGSTPFIEIIDGGPDGDSDEPGDGDADDQLINSTFAGNIYYGAELDFEDVAAERTGLSLAEEAGFVNIDPQAIPLLFGLLGPDAGSPLIDASINSVVTRDVSGRLREGTHDIGAVERTANTPLYGPLSKADVGPIN